MACGEPEQRRKIRGDQEKLRLKRKIDRLLTVDAAEQGGVADDPVQMSHSTQQ